MSEIPGRLPGVWNHNIDSIAKAAALAPQVDHFLGDHRQMIEAAGA